MDNKRILIVEDDILNAFALKMKIEEWGYDVINMVTGGSMAIEESKKNKPDLILVDIFLNDDITGVEAVKEIHKSALIPVIYITAFEDPQTFQMIDETEYRAFIAKPYHYNQVKDAIDLIFH
ncbi:response regulator [bacterium]|nr:response regulator [bacterium]